MKVHSKSYFKNELRDHDYFLQWVNQLEKCNGKKYERIEIQTSIGKTHVWALNTTSQSSVNLIIFPGARTTSLIWDFDNNLNNLLVSARIFMVETNGLPNLSDGSTPDIKSLDYGVWATEVLDNLKIEKAFVAGASFGGLVAMKLAIVSPHRIKAIFLLNPGCLQPFSLSFKNLFYNLLPIFKPSKNAVLTFLNKAIFSKPNHKLSAQSEAMLIDYEIFAITRYADRTQKPYFMGKQLADVKSDVFLLLGDKDLLFPYEKSLINARKYIKCVKDIKVYNQVGHGIETHHMAMQYIGEKIKAYIS
jgi:pimeloyl-ACP methyl ester carboxylesterase